MLPRGWRRLRSLTGWRRIRSPWDKKRAARTARHPKAQTNKRSVVGQLTSDPRHPHHPTDGGRDGRCRYRATQPPLTGKTWPTKQSAAAAQVQVRGKPGRLARADQSAQRHLALQALLAARVGLHLRREIGGRVDEIERQRIDLHAVARLPVRRAIICGSTVRAGLGSGSTIAAKASRHSASPTSAASVPAAGMPKLITSASLVPSPARRARLHRGRPAVRHWRQRRHRARPAPRTTQGLRRPSTASPARAGLCGFRIPQISTPGSGRFGAGQPAPNRGDPALPPGSRYVGTSLTAHSAARAEGNPQTLKRARA